MTAQRLLSAAKDSGLISADVRAEILTEARRGRRDPVDVATTRLRLPREAFYRALAQQRGLPFVEAGALTPDPALIARVPARLLQRKALLPLREEEGRVVVAVGDPDDDAALDPLRRQLGKLELSIADPEALRAAVRRLGPTGAEVAWDAVAFLEDLLRQAYLRRASDVHLDPQEDGLQIRLRVDGRLQAYGGGLASDDAAQLLSRIKVLGGVDIAERREPQDGGFSYRLDDEGQAVDVRLATIPTRHGERATLRLLGVETRELTIERLGFGDEALGRFRQVLAQPHGLVLLTGPTGSGKSTTLYAALRQVASPSLNVMTVEDPVEFLIPGISQIQVDRAGKVTFAGALRSLLRHDPDVLMVGEIRDAETADVALKAALTGHLVLSSLHTNRAVTAVARLVDIGCERYLIASTLRAVIAQRLARRLCAGCKIQQQARPGDLRALGLADGAVVHSPAGCPACMGTGYQGRLALTEALWVDEALAGAIDRGAGDEELLALVQERGFRSLLEDALEKVLAGETSVDEALRVRI
jgi:type IV pilus assembly protein PilB